MSSEGKLIVIEGPDHVGRSMHARLLSERLEAHGVAVKVVGLARSSLLGEIIKTSNSGIHNLNWRTRALLYATDLYDQYIHDIQPLLDAGFVVIADRFTLTPLIRESIRGGDPNWINGLYKNIHTPDITIVLQAGGRRLLNRMMYNDSLTKLNHFEAGADMALSPSITHSFLRYQKLLRAAFIRHAEQEKYPIIHTRNTVSEVHSEVWKYTLPCVEDMLQPIKE